LLFVVFLLLAIFTSMRRGLFYLVDTTMCERDVLKAILQFLAHLYLLRHYTRLLRLLPKLWQSQRPELLLIAFFRQFSRLLLKFRSYGMRFDADNVDNTGILCLFSLWLRVNHSYTDHNAMYASFLPFLHYVEITR